MTAPCLGCAERAPGCYGKCARYAAFRQRIDKGNALRRQEGEAMAVRIEGNRRCRGGLDIKKGYKKKRQGLSLE